MNMLIRIILGLIFILFIAHRGYYSRKYRPVNEDSSVTVGKPDRAHPLVSILSIIGLVSLLLTLLAPRWMAWATVEIPDWIPWLGVGAAAAGFALLQWAQVTLGKNWSDTPRIMKGQQLVTGGPYRYIRHPIYAAFLLILGSPLLITGNLVLGLSWLGMTALDVRERVQFEEAALTEHFGEAYTSYRQQTGALVPRVSPGK